VNDDSNAQSNHNSEVPSHHHSDASANGNGSEIRAARMAESAARTNPRAGGWDAPSGPTAGRPAGAAPSAGSETLARSLKRRGLNAQLVERVVAEAETGRDVATALTEALSALPSAPPLPSETGALIVVAGPLADSVEIASEIAGSVGTLASEVLVASAGPYIASIPPERRLRSAKKAAVRGPAARFGSVGVVAVDIPVGSNSTQWANEIIGALHPTAVVGIVDAVDKADDIEDWADALGGVDSLIVTNPASSRSPATVLDVPIPVSRLGTVRATAASWAAIILDRLA
jgi:hypothetical protein